MRLKRYIKVDDVWETSSGVLETLIIRFVIKWVVTIKKKRLVVSETGVISVHHRHTPDRSFITTSLIFIGRKNEA